MVNLRAPKDRIERFAEEYGLSFNEASDQYHAVMKDLAKHPQVPTDEQFLALEKYCNENNADPAVEWQRRCFVQEEPEEAQCSVCNSPIWKVENGMWSHWGGFPDHQASPEPEIPAEIEDIMFPDLAPDSITARKSELNDLILDAYRRSLRKGEQK